MMSPTVMSVPGPSIDHLCRLFKCTPDAIAKQYSLCAAQMREMGATAEKRGGKYRGCTVEHYAERAAFMDMKAAEARLVAAAGAA